MNICQHMNNKNKKTFVFLRDFGGMRKWAQELPYGKKRYFCPCRGLTLIETMVWISMFTFAMIALVSALLSFYRSNTYTIEQAQATASAQRGVARMVETLREATLASDGAYPVVSIGTDEITLYSDIDDDPLIERVRFFIQGTELRQATLEPSGSPLAYTGSDVESVVSHDVRNGVAGIVTFRYFDAGGNEITEFSDVSGVRFITIDLVVNVNPDRLPNELTLRSSATLRNLKD